jgi:hypothetical protein
MTVQRELEIAHATCPCWDPQWGSRKCRNCESQQKHIIDDCEWRGHAAIDRVVGATRLDDLERIKGFVDRDSTISGEVRKTLQGAS